MGPDRTALLHCRDNPGTSERLLRKRFGDSQPLTLGSTAEIFYWDHVNRNKMSLKKASEIGLNKG